MVMTAASRLLGLVRIRIISSLVGATLMGDLLFFTLNIPNNVRKIFAEGAFSSAFVPEYSCRYHRDKQEAGQFFFRTAAVLCIISAVMGAGFLLFGSQLLHAVSDFGDEVIHPAGIVLLGIFTIYTLGIFLTNAASGALHVRRRFFAPSLAPLILSASVIVCSLLLFDLWGVYAVAAGFAVGALIPAVWLMLVMLRRIPETAVRISLRDSRTFFRRWGRLIALQSAFLVSQQVSFYLASTLQEGNVIQYSNAIILWQMPFGVFFASIMTVLYPMISQFHHQGEHAELAGTMNTGIEHVLTFLLPSAVLLTVFSREVCTVVLLAGNYTQEAADQTAAILRFFAPGMVLLGLTQLFLRKYYLQQFWKKAAVITLLAASLDILFSILLIRTPLGITGLAAAFTAAYGITALCAVDFSLIHRKTAQTCLKIIFSNILMLAVLAVLVRLVPLQSRGLMEAILRIIFLGAPAALLLGLLYRKIGISFFRLLRSRQS